MTRPSCRRTTLLATALLAALAPRPAAAQDPIGLVVDLAALKVRQQQIKHDQVRIQDDIDRGDAAAMNRDLLQIRRHERSAQRFQRWVRADVFLPLGFYRYPPPPPPVPPSPTLIPHPQYPGHGYFPSDPDHLYRLPQPAPLTNVTSPGVASAAPAPAARVPVEIVNTGPPGAVVDYVVDGVAYRIEGGRRVRLAVGPGSTIAYDPGGGLGRRRYSLSAGTYEFRPGDPGRALVKLRPPSH